MHITNRKLAIGVVLTVGLLLARTALAGEPGFGGTLVYGDGQTVTFERLTLGESGDPAKYMIKGRVGQQRVKYAFSELKNIEFADYRTESYHEDRRGDLVVTGKTGKQITVTDAFVYCRSPGRDGSIYYRYNDPVTGKVKHQGQPIYQSIARIMIGEHQGRLKKNPTTGEYYPASYNFDPFSGRKLIWSTRPGKTNK